MVEILSESTIDIIQEISPNKYVLKKPRKNIISSCFIVIFVFGLLLLSVSLLRNNAEESLPKTIIAIFILIIDIIVSHYVPYDEKIVIDKNKNEITIFRKTVSDEKKYLLGRISQIENVILAHYKLENKGGPYEVYDFYFLLKDTKRLFLFFKSQHQVNINEKLLFEKNSSKIKEIAKIIDCKALIINENLDQELNIIKLDELEELNDDDTTGSISVTCSLHPIKETCNDENEKLIRKIGYIDNDIIQLLVYPYYSVLKPISVFSFVSFDIFMISAFFTHNKSTFSLLLLGSIISILFTFFFVFLSSKTKMTSKIKLSENYICRKIEIIGYNVFSDIIMFQDIKNIRLIKKNNNPSTFQYDVYADYTIKSKSGIEKLGHKLILSGYCPKNCVKNKFKHLHDFKAIEASVKALCELVNCKYEFEEIKEERRERRD